MSRSEPPSPQAAGLAWVSRIMGLSLEFVLPAVAGYLLDRRLGTLPVATIAGTAAGFAVGLYHLVHLARSPRA